MENYLLNGQNFKLCLIIFFGVYFEICIRINWQNPHLTVRLFKGRATNNMRANINWDCLRPLNQKQSKIRSKGDSDVFPNRTILRWYNYTFCASYCSHHLYSTVVLFKKKSFEMYFFLPFSFHLETGEPSIFFNFRKGGHLVPQKCVIASRFIQTYSRLNWTKERHHFLQILKAWTDFE